MKYQFKQYLFLLAVVGTFLCGCNAVENETMEQNPSANAEVSSSFITEGIPFTDNSKEPEAFLTPVNTITPVPTNTPAPTNTPTPTVSPTPTSTPTPTPQIINITISATGDITLGINQKHTYDHSFHEYYDNYGEDYFLKNVKSIFEADDFTIVNHDGTLTTSDNIRTTKEWNHKGRPEYAGILSHASVEAVTLGNNHIMDYQWEGVNDTIQAVTDYGMEYAISGPWGDHYGLYETEKGIKIGFVSVNEYYDGKESISFWRKDLQSFGKPVLIWCSPVRTGAATKPM